MEEGYSKIESKYYNLQELIELRHWFHQNPELSLVEHNTMAKIKEVAANFGVPESSFKVCGKTGWQIDISGKGPATGTARLIGVRSDHDALPINENNPHLAYSSSKSGVAHMCGHDGHTTSLLGGLALVMGNLDKIPSDRTVRFIFQPAEEGFGGAELMIGDGVLNGMAEIYGCHNMPRSDLPYKMLVADREMMSNMQVVEIKIFGVGGHGSAPEKCNNPIPIAARAYLEILEKLTEYQKNVSGSVRFSLCSFNGGHAFNVIPTTVEITGTLRDFDPKDEAAMNATIRTVLESICKETNSTFEYKCKKSSRGPVVNIPELAQHVRSVGQKLFGTGQISNAGCPVYASEDFADFMDIVPGCLFFMVGHNLPAGYTLHSDRFDFDDNIIDDLAKFWFRLIESRLNAD